MIGDAEFEMTRGRPEVGTLMLAERRFSATVDAEGYSSNRICKRSTICCRVQRSPGFLSEYIKTTSWAQGVGHELRSAKHPIDDVESAFRQRSSS